MSKKERRESLGPYMEAGEAVVSADGIRFLGRIYTLRLAVQEQWYIRAYEEEPWKITLYCDVQLLCIFLKRNDTYYLCEPIDQTEMDSERIHNEIRLFSQLKQRWMSLKAGNKAMNHFPGKRSNR
jgi:hypothetical protein